MFFFENNVGDGGLGEPINWNAVINQGIALGSHAISAFSGQHTGTQIGYNVSQGGVFAITPRYDETPYYGGGYGNLSPQQLAALQAAQGGVAEDALGSITRFVSDHPIMIGGIVLGLYLLNREPPRRR